MSWSPDLYTGEMRPWPESVTVRRGNESKTYVPICGGGRMSEIKLTVRTFRMDTDKRAALKPLGEAAEVFGAWQETDGCGRSEQCMEWSIEDEVGCFGYIELADELADVIQAACNLADRYGIDLQAAMERCEERNRRRGRYERRANA